MSWLMMVGHGVLEISGLEDKILMWIYLNYLIRVDIDGWKEPKGFTKRNKRCSGCFRISASSGCSLQLYFLIVGGRSIFANLTNSTISFSDYLLTIIFFFFFLEKGNAFLCSREDFNRALYGNALPVCPQTLIILCNMTNISRCFAKCWAYCYTTWLFHLSTTWNVWNAKHVAESLSFKKKSCILRHSSTGHSLLQFIATAQSTVGNSLNNNFWIE